MRQMITRTAALYAALAAFVAAAPCPATAGFGDPSRAAEFVELRAALGTTGRTPEQLHETFVIGTNHASQVKPIDEQIAAIRGYISDRLAGNGPVDLGDLGPLQQQVATLQGQHDALDLEWTIAIRAILTPDQIARAAAQHQKRAAVEATDKQFIPSSLPEPIREPNDLYGDKLGFTRGVALTDAQKEQMATLKAASARVDSVIQLKYAAVRDQIRDQLASTAAITLPQLAPLQQKASTLKSQHDAERLRLAIQIRALLTPAQLDRGADLHLQLAALAQENALLDQNKSGN